MSYMECRHIKSNGCKCKAVALSGAPYCYFHMHLHRARHGQKTKTRAAIDMPAIEDRTAVQLALTQVLQGLGSRCIKPTEARLYLYGLQIAAQLVDRPGYISASDYVQKLTTTNDGEEMGPDLYVCDTEEDCDDCPFADTCTKFLKDEDEEDEDEDEQEEDSN